MNEASDTEFAVSEEDLVRDAQSGRTEAFERLFELHVRRVYALCLRLVTDPQRAEELTQGAFERAWNMISSYRFDGTFGAWLHQTGIGFVVRELRSERAREELEITAELLEQFESEVLEAMPESRIELERAIALLPRGPKEALILHDIEGYRYGDIAAMTGVAEGTVKAQLSQARQLVREALIR